MLNNLYPTDTNTTYYQNELEYTQFIQNISGITLGTDFAKSYYMGYLPQDSFPETVFGFTMPRLSEDNTTILLNNHVKENRPWGFCKLRETSANANVLPLQAYYFNASNQLSRIVSSDWASIRFINKLTLANLTVKDLIILTIKFRIVPTADLDGNGSGRAVTTVSWQNSISLIELVDFVRGDLSFTCNISQSYVSTTKIIHYSDFDENTLTYHYTENGYEVFVQLQDFDIGSGHVYNHENTRIYDANIVPFYRTHIPDGYGYPEQDILVTGYNYQSIATDVRYEFYDTGSHDTFTPSSMPGLPLAGGSYNGTLNNFNIIRGKFPIDSVIASDIPVLTGSGSGIVYNCLFIDAKSGSGGTFSFIPAIDFKDVLKAAFMRNSVYCGADQSVTSLPLLTTYTDEEAVSYFNEDDIPFFDNTELQVYEWGEQGDLALLSGLLRPWQLPNADITEDDFDVDTMPEYNPPEPEDSADSGGDTIAPYDFTNTPLSAANNFTTLYALTTAQVAEFGAIMWASLSDPNFWHAVGVTFENDFSINPADMMRYFNFLRYYPFDLTEYSTSYASGIYIGRSTMPLQFPAGFEYPRRVNRNLIQIDGGTVTPTLPAPYNTDDFRVMDPATQIQAHIPFCGAVQLPAAECYGKQLSLKYVVDLQTGSIQATISVQSDTFYIIATLAGTCGAAVQITANNNIEFLTRIATVATGGISSAANMATQGAKIAGEEGAIVGAVAGALTGTVSALAGLPPVTVHKQASTTGFANFGGDPQAYITIQTPKRAKPASYAKSIGYVSNKQAKIADLSGYTEMINPDLSGIPAHQDELEEIRQLLETGFYA